MINETEQRCTIHVTHLSIEAERGGDVGVEEAQRQEPHGRVHDRGERGLRGAAAACATRKQRVFAHSGRPPRGCMRAGPRWRRRR